MLNIKMLIINCLLCVLFLVNYGPIILNIVFQCNNVIRTFNEAKLNLSNNQRNKICNLYRIKKVIKL